MSDVVIETPAGEKPETASELFARLKAAKVEAARPEAITAKAAADKAAADAVAGAVVHKPEKRASGDERKFTRLLSKRDQEIGELRARLDAALPKTEVKAEPVAGAAPKREDFATDELFNDAKTAHTVQKALDKKATEDANASQRQAIVDGYNERMAHAPELYPDWDEVIAAAATDPAGQALKGDLGKECPILFMAIAKSKQNVACFYEWMKAPAKLQALIDLYKSGPDGPMEARDEFLRFEGRVAKEVKAEAVKEKPAKAVDAVKVTPAKPKPSAEASVRGGSPAPDGAPSIYLAGTHTLNPAYKVWKRQQRAA